MCSCFKNFTGFTAKRESNPASQPRFASSACSELPSHRTDVRAVAHSTHVEAVRGRDLELDATTNSSILRTRLCVEAVCGRHRKLDATAKTEKSFGLLSRFAIKSDKRVNVGIRQNRAWFGFEFLCHVLQFAKPSGLRAFWHANAHKNRAACCLAYDYPFANPQGGNL